MIDSREMPKYVFKYKGGKQRDFTALLNDSLWVSSIALLNDPCDISTYYDYYGNNKRYALQFFESFKSCCFCASFGLSWRNSILWNYYADGFRGFCLKYDTNELEHAFRKSKYLKNFCPGYIAYSNKKEDFTKIIDKFLEQRRLDGIIPNVFFKKNKLWERESELRYNFGTPLKIKPGYFVRGLKPCAIYVGFRMDPNQMDRIKKYCFENKTKLFLVTPNFFEEYGNKLSYKEISVNV